MRKLAIYCLFFICILSVSDVYAGLHTRARGGIDTECRLSTGTLLPLDGSKPITGSLEVVYCIYGSTAVFSGNITANAYYGDGSNLTGIQTDIPFSWCGQFETDLFATTIAEIKLPYDVVLTTSYLSISPLGTAPMANTNFNIYASTSSSGYYSVMTSSYVICISSGSKDETINYTDFSSTIFSKGNYLRLDCGYAPGSPETGTNLLWDILGLKND